MTREELQEAVPVYQYQDRPSCAKYIRIVDIPNPYRTECARDHLGAGSPERGCLWASDWATWLHARFSGQYEPRHDQNAPILDDSMAARW